MTLTLWLSLVAACLVISLTPGAGAVNTMTTSLLHGWKKAFFTVMGQQLAPQLPQYLVLAGTMVAIDIVVMWGGFALVAKTLTRLSHSERGQTILNRVFGSLFILVAALMIFAGH